MKWEHYQISSIKSLQHFVFAALLHYRGIPSPYVYFFPLIQSPRGLMVRQRCSLAVWKTLEGQGISPIKIVIRFSFLVGGKDTSAVMSRA